MSSRGLYWRLWLRMAVAGAVGVLGTVTVVVIEFGLSMLGFLTLFLTLEERGIRLLVLSIPLVVSSLVVVWWVAAVLFEWEPDGTVGQPHPTEGDLPRLVVPVAVGAGVLVGGHELAVVRLGISPLWVAAVCSVVVVGWLQYRLVTSVFRPGAIDELLAEGDEFAETREGRDAIESRIRRLAGLAGTVPPAVQVVDTDEPHAMAFGFRPAESVLVVSSGLLDLLDEQELDAVLAHELAHLLNRDAALLTALSIPATKAGRLYRQYPHPFLLVVVVPVFLSSRLAVGFVGRYREYVADHSAARLTGDPAALASALETLDGQRADPPSTDVRVTEAFNIVPPSPPDPRSDDLAWLRATVRYTHRRLFGTHPSTGSRVRRLQTFDGTDD